MLMDANIKICTCQVLGYFCLQSCAGHVTYSNKTKKRAETRLKAQLVQTDLWLMKV